MKCIIKADDFGLSHGINLAIIESYKNGIVKNAGIMVNMKYAKEAVEMAKQCSDLTLGLHVNVSIGQPLTEISLISSLVDEKGNFHSSKECREKIAECKDPFPIYEEIEKEVENQILKFYELCHRFPSYIDAHAIHSHNLFKSMSFCAKKYNIMHYSYEESLSYKITVLPFRAIPPYEFYKKGIYPYEYFTENYCKILDKDYALVFMHPGFVDYELYDLTSYIKVRTQDFVAVTHSNTLEWMKQNNVESINYTEIEEKEK